MMWTSRLLTFIAFLVQYGFCDQLIVQLNHGKIRGLESVDENGNIFYAFKGIPYAEAPKDFLRFKPPVQKLPWDGILETVADGPPCPQVSILYPTSGCQGTEDNCLTLNVYTPQLHSDKLDVVVHIHGGGFAMGSGGENFLYNPKRFMPKEKNIVLVSITYRVSSLGFLSTGDSISPGNYGLLDQVEALKWVRNNIDRFGGDPTKVTIFGESAGGASVMYHYISPLSKGLFHRAIAMSGTVLNPWAYQDDPKPWAIDLANRVGCPVDDLKQLVECLKTLSAEKLIINEETKINQLMHLVYTPTVDHFFLPDTPFNMINKKQYNDVPLIIGVTLEEGACWSSLNPGPKNPNGEFTDEEINQLLKMLFSSVTNLDKVIPKVKSKYFTNSKKKADVDKCYGKVVTDGYFQKYNYLTIKMLAEKGSKVYAYTYDYEGNDKVIRMLFNVPKDTRIGACHAVDLANFFTSPFAENEPQNDEDLDMKHQMQKLFYNFVSHGTPNSDDVKVKWPPVEANKLYIYNINTKSSVSIYDDSRDEEYEFWVKTVPKTIGWHHQLWKNEQSPVKEEL